MIQLGGRYNILIESGIPIKLVKLIKLFLNTTYKAAGFVNTCLTHFLL